MHIDTLFDTDAS